MAKGDKGNKARTSDIAPESSLISDITALAEVLRATRLSRQLSQAELAHKLGLRQRQISDLERATTDPRLSTIHNVARALELELMLIPRHLISAVNALQRSGSDAAKRPLYALGDDDAQAEDDEPSQPEVGDSGKSNGQPDQRSHARRRKER
jgi:transcriptional regulator with XRE-family HTH domain